MKNSMKNKSKTDSESEKTSFMVQGRISRADGKSIAGIKVSAFNKKLRSDVC